jgi:hypothetical protein
MYKALSVGLLAVSLTVSTGVHAQALRSPTVAPAAPPAPVTISHTASGVEFTISPAGLLAIGSGSAIGIVLAGLLLPGNLAYAYGGLAGAYVGYVWYTQGYSLYQLYQSKS